MVHLICRWRRWPGLVRYRPRAREEIRRAWLRPGDRGLQWPGW